VAHTVRFALAHRGHALEPLDQASDGLGFVGDLAGQAIEVGFELLSVGLEILEQLKDLQVVAGERVERGLRSATTMKVRLLLRVRHS
jgi:hypothetical protein